VSSETKLCFQKITSTKIKINISQFLQFNLDPDMVPDKKRDPHKTKADPERLIAANIENHLAKASSISLTGKKSMVPVKNDFVPVPVLSGKKYTGISPG
jgi:hypothetical protein